MITVEMELAKQDALRTLGMLPVSIFKAPDVMTYYRAKVRAACPDSMKGTGVVDRHTLQQLRYSKDFLIKWLEENDDD